MTMEPPKRFSTTLLEAVQNIDQLSHAHLALLMRRAAIRLKKYEDSGLEIDDAANDDEDLEKG